MESVLDDDDDDGFTLELSPGLLSLYITYSISIQQKKKKKESLPMWSETRSSNIYIDIDIVFLKGGCRVLVL